MVLVIIAYGPRAISGGTACGKQGMGGANKSIASGYRGKHGAGNLYERLTFSMGFHSRSWDSGQVGMSNVLSHDGDRILV